MTLTKINQDIYKYENLISNCSNLREKERYQRHLQRLHVWKKQIEQDKTAKI
jgi:hypothetical protein